MSPPPAFRTNATNKPASNWPDTVAAYGSRYGSGKLFRFPGPHVVNDDIHLHVTIHAERRNDSDGIST